MERAKKTVESFGELIETIRQMFADDEVDVELVKDLLASYESKPAEWKQYAFFDPNRWGGPASPALPVIGKSICPKRITHFPIEPPF